MIHRIQYKKTDSGVVVVKSEDVDINRKPETRIERFNAFFQNVPLWGGHEWRTLGVNDIVQVFREAADDIREEYERRHDEAICEHMAKNRIMRRWQEYRGWKAPYVPTVSEIITDMAVRCTNLSTWMLENSNRPFYEGSDMSAFIDKPAAVARQLLE